MYDYSGFLKTVLPAPNREQAQNVDSIVFSADDIAGWTTRDIDSDREWQEIPASHTRTDDADPAVRLTGQFNQVRRIDALAADDPSFWVPLGTLGTNDSRFPLDLERYPIVEITYRCTSENARPAWVWRYYGGLHFDWLPSSRQWRTVVRRIRHFGFPDKLEAVVFRLYSTARTTESVEIQQVRFRAYTPEEADTVARVESSLLQEYRPPRYPILEEFLPLSVYMSALSARRLAERLGISLEEYWNLAFEDIVAHRHNCVIVEDVEQLIGNDWHELLAVAASYGLRLVPVENARRFDTLESEKRFIEERIRPHAQSNSILAWSLYDEPPEREFQNLLRLKKFMEEADPNHPMIVITRHPSAYPLYAPFFAASGIDHYTSHSPWDIGPMVRNHAALSGGQQFWMVAPAFVYATGTPEWSSCAEMRLMVNLAFANGARGWSAYAYHNDAIWLHGSCQRSLTGPFLMFSDLWAELGERMERYSALAPLLLNARPARLPEKWYVSATRTDDKRQLPEPISLIGSYRLRGPDYNLYSVVSHDVRAMISVNIDIPADVMKGYEIYDIFDFIQNREWVPMDLTRHLEMFPGQARVVLVAPPHVCARWRDVLAQRLIDENRRQLNILMKLARAYPLDFESIEKITAGLGSGDVLRDLHTMDNAHDTLLDMIYACDDIQVPRSRIIEASAAICACDGALCRLLNRGMQKEAGAYGQKVAPLAREVTRMRLELRHGNGARIAEHCARLTHEVLRLLAEIRALA
jgi:hypothetical protein